MMNVGRRSGKTLDMLRDAFEAAQAGEVVLIASAYPDKDVVMLPASRYRELLASPDRSADR